MATEKTPLTGPSPSASTSFGSGPAMPFYVQDTYRFYSRRRRERQLQCIMFFTIVATFIMALIVTISYSVNHPDIVPPENLPESPNITPPNNETPPPVQATATSPKSPNPSAPSLQQREPPLQKASAPELLSVDEVKLAVSAGNDAIAARRLADSATRPLPSPSPDSRHQFAVKTSLRADRLAMAGIAEIAATKKIESARSFMGKPTSFGSFINGGWAPESACTRSLDVQCPVYAAKYRRFDGSCNHPEQLGMAYAPYRRSLPPDYADGINAPRVGKFGNPLPSAREVSLKVHPPSPSTNPSFTVMLAVFGQFLDHDMTATAISRGTNGSSLSCCPPSGEHPECFAVKVGPGDPVYDVAGSSCMEFVRSAPAAQCKIGPRQQLNQVTSFIDGSTIYGSDVDTAESLREFSGGRLRMQTTPDQRQLLPASTNPEDGCNRQLELMRGRYCFATGDPRANENLHLTTMHLLWARQHNRLADGLAKLNPQWDDEKVYQETRRIVGAQMQHITYSEFVPIVLGEGETSARNLKPLSAGFRARNASDVNPAIANHFAAAAFRFAHTLLPGLMKVTDTEKGTSSYVQLHRMLFNPYSLYSEGGVESSITTATTNAIQKTSTHVTSQLTEHLFEDPMGNQTTVPCGLDLVSLNIQRGRDHGLPGYTKWREYCGLPKPLKFDDLKGDMDPEALDSISKLYDNVDDVDLYTGALAEVTKGDGLVGPTFTCLIADQFERLQLGDKYWYETPDEPGSFNEAQLKEIRKTSLARLICDTSDNITQVQARVMRSVGADNPIISCEDIPELSLDAWKSEMPLLTLTEAEVPMADWLNFRTEVNKTIGEIVASITAKKPLPGSLPADWQVFQNDVNATFTDLRNKFAALHPKVVTNVSLSRNLTAEPDTFDWASVKTEVDKTVADILDSLNANKPPPGSLPADWAVYRKKINDSLLDIKKKFKVVHPKLTASEPNSKNLKTIGDIPTIDWVSIKGDLNATITDVISSINASKPLPGSPPADWFAFKKKIIDSLAGIKGKFAGLHPKIVPNVSLSRNLTAEPDTFDWASVKTEVDKTVADILDSLNANKPPPGSLPADWAVYRKKINDSLLDIKKKFKVVHPKLTASEPNSKNLKTIGDIPTIDWVSIKGDLNATITDVISSINASKPLPGSPPADWFAFKKKIIDSLAGIKGKFAGLHPKPVTPSVTLTATGDQAVFDWVQFKNELNKTLNDIITSNASKQPPAGSTHADWVAFQNELNDTFAQFMNQFAGLHPKPVNEKENVMSNDPIDPPIVNDVTKAQDNVNKTMKEIIAEITASRPAPGSSQEEWTAFQQKMSTAFANMKDKFAYSKTTKNANRTIVKLQKPPIDTTFDAVAFREDLNKTLSDLVSTIKTKKPAVNSSIADWLAYKKEIKASVSKIKDQFVTIKTKELLDPDYILYATESDVAFDWMGWKNQINNTIDNILDDIKTIPPGDPKWASFRDKINKTFGDLKNDVAAMRVKPTEQKSETSKLMAIINEDFKNFKDKINSTIEDTLEDIDNNKPPPGDPSWVTYNAYIKSKFGEMRDDLKAMKTEWLEKVQAATEMMIVTNSELPIGSSASSFKIQLYGTNYCFGAVMTLISFKFFMF